jgi:lysyl-tRNA synthetase class 2
VSRYEFLVFRAQVFKSLRSALEERGYLEVETPLRVRTPGTDVNIDAFASEERYLITSPEFHLKRLLSEGFTRLYQICKCFRKGERTSLHNPEFTMLEFYAAGLKLEDLMQELENLIREVATIAGVSSVTYGGVTGDLSRPWERLSVNEAFQRWAGWSPIEAFEEDRFYFDLVDKVDRRLGKEKPLFFYDYPAELAMLARRDPNDPRVARRFELYMAGVEIANAFEELTDPVEQRARFEEDLRRRAAQGKPLFPIDEKLLEALPRIPTPTSGVAVGLDRLVMLLAGAGSVEEVMAFPDEEA